MAVSDPVQCEIYIPAEVRYLVPAPGKGFDCVGMKARRLEDLGRGQ